MFLNRWGVVYQNAVADVGGGGHGGRSVATRSDMHDTFVKALDGLEKSGKIEELDPFGSMRSFDDEPEPEPQERSPRRSAREPDPVDEDQGDTEHIDDSGLGGDSDTFAEHSGDDSAPPGEDAEESAELQHMARRLGLSQTTVESLSSDQLRTTLTDLLRSRLPDPRDLRAQQARQRQPNPDGQQYPQNDPAAGKPNGDPKPQAASGKPSFKDQVAALNKDDWDPQLLTLLESLGADNEELGKRNGLLEALVARQGATLDHSYQSELARERVTLDRLIDDIGDFDTFGKSEDFANYKAGQQLSKQQAEQVLASRDLEFRVHQIRQQTGAPLTKTVVRQAYRDLWGDKKSEATRESSRKVLSQSRQRMGGSGRASSGSGGKYQGPPEKHPDLVAMFNEFQVQNNGA